MDRPRFWLGRDSADALPGSFRTKFCPEGLAEVAGVAVTSQRPSRAVPVRNSAPEGPTEVVVTAAVASAAVTAMATTVVEMSVVAEMSVFAR